MTPQEQVENLYSRPWPELEPDPVPSILGGRTVMVTGAGGSIGSRLCQRIAQYQPDALVGFDVSEAGLFELDREMRARFPGIRFYAELGSIQNPTRIKQLLRRHRPEIIYHAAAYKHVPMLQDQLVEAVRNNAIATWDLASQALEHGVERLVLISTDKAVRAHNVLGLTKRMAEAAVESLAHAGYPYFAVRLGNVLGSSGSVSRIFQSQIEQGMPITLTDLRMARYFTTMDEASRFVLDASAIGTGGEVYSLEMGEPVRIEELARQMIAVNGMETPIVVTGKRPGEELSEDLFQAGEVPRATIHPRIHRVDRTARAVPVERMKSAMQSMREYCEAGRSEALRAVMDEICCAGARL